MQVPGKDRCKLADQCRAHGSWCSKEKSCQANLAPIVAGCSSSLPCAICSEFERGSGVTTRKTSSGAVGISYFVMRPHSTVGSGWKFLFCCYEFGTRTGHESACFASGDVAVCCPPSPRNSFHSAFAE